MVSKIKGIGIGILFVIFVYMVVWGQKTIGLTYLGVQLLGVAGLLGLLYLYNRKYR